ncbi:MAG: MotA/TolQ/ExbB proton channel family protein [Flavobacteriales bacterium]
MNLYDFISMQIETATGAVSGTAETVAENTVNVQELSIWELVLSGGWYIMIPLAFCSILAVYIFVERFLAIQKALKGEKEFVYKIKDLISDGKLEAAKTLCSTTENPAARMIEKGISRIGKPIKDIEASIENVGKLEIHRLESRLSVLATISGAAPMIGFLGTVIGMINTFYNMAQNGVEIQNLSGGIMQAMVTTVAGLIVGIIAYIAYNYLVTKVEKVIHQMETAAIGFLDILETPGK